MSLVALHGVTSREEADEGGVPAHVWYVIKAAGYTPVTEPVVTIEEDKGAPYGVHWTVTFEAAEEAVEVEHVPYNAVDAAVFREALRRGGA